MSASMRVYESLRERIRQHADRLAVVCGPARFRFSDLARETDRLVGAFSRLGITRRHVVGLALPNQAMLVPAYLALCALDAAVALISTKYRDHELDAIVARTGPRWILTGHAESAELTTSLGAQCVESRHVDAAEPLIALKIADLPDVSIPEDVALLKFTSGSTGQPKGIGLTADNVLAETACVVDTLAVAPDDRILALVPLTHSYGFDLGVLASLSSGACLHVGSGFVPRMTLQYLQSERISIFLGVPPMYRSLIDTRLRALPDLSGVRYLLSCTAPLSAATIREFHERFGAVICQHYGSSETGAATNHVPSEVLNRMESVGRPMAGVTVSIVDEHGGPVAPGNVGEVIVSGPAVAPRYIMGQPLGRNPLHAGSYRTGEIGLLDDAGFLHLRGRIDHLINVGGLKVGPDEVSAVLEQHPAVREAAVIGAKDAAGEEFVYAAVTLRSESDESALIEFCGRHLAQYKVPRRIDIRDHLPRGATGKVQLRPEDIVI